MFCPWLQFSVIIYPESLTEASAPSHQLSGVLRSREVGADFYANRAVRVGGFSFTFSSPCLVLTHCQLCLWPVPLLAGEHSHSSAMLGRDSCVHPHQEMYSNDTHNSLTQSVHVSRPSVLLVFADVRQGSLEWPRGVGGAWDKWQRATVAL